MRVLWLCDCPLTDSDPGATGTWQAAMARGLVGSGQVELGIIGTASVSGSVRRDYCGVRQWLFPSRTTLGRDGLPPAQFVDAIAEASREFRPDLVHVWGTESYWGLLRRDGYCPIHRFWKCRGLSQRSLAFIAVRLRLANNCVASGSKR